MHRKLILMLIAAGLLVFGIGVSGAVADDDSPAAPPVACSALTPGADEQDAAAAVANASANVSDQAESEEADDEEGDQQDELDDDELGDCDDEDDDDEEDDD